MTKKRGGKYAAPRAQDKFWPLKALGALILFAGTICLSGWLLQTLLLSYSDPGTAQGSSASYSMMDRYEMQMTNTVSDALDGVLSIKKTYWLSDSDQVAPEPNQDNYGSTTDPSTLGWLLEEAEELLDGQQLHFNTDVEIAPNTEVMYYIDDTIVAITWKQIVNSVTYTISEVKISHPSQFRRFLAGGEYGSSVQLTTTEMAASVNAVVASSGDFYKFRSSGIIVYDGELRKMSGTHFDTCFIDEDGNLQFVYAGQITKWVKAEEYIENNNIRFSLGFGPVMIEDGQIVNINKNYSLGEVNDNYARAGLGQLGELHYVLVTGNSEHHGAVPTVFDFAEVGMMLGCDKFYNLDGGQTAVICMNDKLINKVVYGAQRQISDIIYFATAIPEGG